jgi:hypothetical protein
VYDPRVARFLALCLLAPLLMGGDCAGITCPPAAPQMTAARAKEIDPTIQTGLALSTTHVFGDCRPADPATPAGTCGDDGPCARRRSPLRVLVLPVNVSVPIAERCDPELAVEDGAEAAVFDGHASDQGELVIAMDPGTYALFLSSDDRCAACGLTQEGGVCTVDVLSGRLTVRDLILDRATH